MGGRAYKPGPCGEKVNTRQEECPARSSPSRESNQKGRRDSRGERCLRASEREGPVKIISFQRDLLSGELPCTRAGSSRPPSTLHYKPYDAICKGPGSRRHPGAEEDGSSSSAPLPHKNKYRLFPSLCRETMLDFAPAVTARWRSSRARRPGLIPFSRREEP